MKGIISLLKAIAWLSGGILLAAAAHYSSHVIKRKQQELEPVHKPKPHEWSEEDITFSWLGQSTVLMNLNGVRIITDPNLSKSTHEQRDGSIINIRPVLSEKEIGDLDLILLSHGYIPELDSALLNKLAGPSTTIITVENASRLLDEIKDSEIKELSIREKHQLRDDLTVTGVKVEHREGPFPWDERFGYCGFLVRKGKKRVWYAGDSAYVSSYKQLRFLGKKEVAVIPIGGSGFVHCTPEEAWAIFSDSGAARLFPILFDHPSLSHRESEELLERLYIAAGEKRDRIIRLEPGETYRLTDHS
ncbi:MBL fold metallo-hydrolase [Jeotgalibacillus soli]|uniref:Metallo-beta-lactamase domain-containing protein n=1 Tax=Jeotgalibacillus soli TaxID=889306 RepID=A0A0C2VYZ3_9BACL|nr:MBL fold metallo-hydrolase [Jeotgalibacillus soli]KIL49611.1 hypothetical protein KP78_10790 [Jeotgalibacillus soli]